MIRNVSVEANWSHNADGDLSQAFVTSVRRGKGDKEMRVSDDRVECLTSVDIDWEKGVVSYCCTA